MLLRYRVLGFEAEGRRQVLTLPYESEKRYIQIILLRYLFQYFILSLPQKSSICQWFGDEKLQKLGVQLLPVARSLLPVPYLHKKLFQPTQITVAKIIKRVSIAHPRFGLSIKIGKYGWIYHHHLLPVLGLLVQPPVTVCCSFWLRGLNSCLAVVSLFLEFNLRLFCLDMSKFA